MEEKIVRLSNDLRKKGMPVSVRSTQSAIDAYAILGEDNVDTLKDAFRSIYVKSKYDIPKFNKVFEKIFRFLYAWGEEVLFCKKALPLPMHPLTYEKT